MTTTRENRENDRDRLLSQAIANAVASGGRVESQGPDQAVIVKGKRPNHILHLLLCVSTVGLWAVVWLGMVVFGGEKRQIIRVDEHGNTLVEKV